MKPNFYTYYLLIALLTTGLAACSERFPTADFTKGSTDTVFLRNISEQRQFEGVNFRIWNKVFIDPDRQSPMYDHVLDFSDMEMYFTDYGVKDLKTFDTSMVPDEWVPLHKYKEQYFIYKPGDEDIKYALRDSLFIHFFWEPTYFKIENFEQVSKNHYRFQTTGVPNSVDRPIFEIFIVDPANNIAVWKQTGASWGGNRYRLFIAKESAKKFAVVVNIASDKPLEFEFDPIDFKEILRRGGFETTR